MGRGIERVSHRRGMGVMIACGAGKSRRGAWRRALLPAVGFALGFGFLASCASEQPVTVAFPKGVNPRTNVPEITYPKGQNGGEPRESAVATPKAPQTVTVPLVDYRPPNEPVAPKAPAGAKELVAANNIRFEIRPEEDSYRGGAVVYPYIPNHVYMLFVSPLQLTDIELQPGESIVSPPAAGDTDDFMVGTAESIQEGERVVHVDVKSVYPNKQTTLAIYTDRRTYTFRVMSYENVYMPLVSFEYPLDMAKQMQEAQARAEGHLLMYGKITDLDFGYKIIPHSVNLPHWMPSIVFTDGRRTYIQFASAARASYAPVLFSINSKGERVLVNYRVVGDYYIVDGVLHHAELVLDVNDGNIVTILKN